MDFFCSVAVACLKLQVVLGDDALLFWVLMGSAAQDKPAQVQLPQWLDDSWVLAALFRSWDGLM